MCAVCSVRAMCIVCVVYMCVSARAVVVYIVCAVSVCMLIVHRESKQEYKEPRRSVVLMMK